MMHSLRLPTKRDTRFCFIWNSCSEAQVHAALYAEFAFSAPMQAYFISSTVNCAFLEKFEQFLRSYFNKFKNQSVDTDDFKTHLQSYFVGEEKIKEIDWNAWLHTPGMPHIIPK